MSAPWPPEEALGLARENIEGGDFNGLYLASMAEGNAVIPCIENPRATAAMFGLNVMAGRMESPDWIIFIGDTYHFSEDVPEEELPVGQLGDLFEAGDPRVKEAAVALCCCPDGPSYQAIQTYVRDGGEIEWDEVILQTDTSVIGGALWDLMVAVLATEFGAMPEAAQGLGIGRRRLM
jgi:hypothetical protein